MLHHHCSSHFARLTPRPYGAGNNREGGPRAVAGWRGWGRAGVVRGFSPTSSCLARAWLWGRSGGSVRIGVAMLISLSLASVSVIILSSLSSLFPAECGIPGRKSSNATTTQQTHRHNCQVYRRGVELGCDALSPGTPLLCLVYGRRDGARV